MFNEIKNHPVRIAIILRKISGHSLILIEHSHIPQYLLYFGLICDAITEKSRSARKGLSIVKYVYELQ